MKYGECCLLALATVVLVGVGGSTAAQESSAAGLSRSGFAGSGPAGSGVDKPGQTTASTQDSITATDLVHLRRIVGLDVARDGSFAVYAQLETRADFEAERDRDAGYESHLWLIDLEDPEAQPVQLTHGRRRDGDPRIRPDGSALAFVRSEHPGDDETSGRQVWSLPLDGPGEARALTDLEHGAAAPRWRPEGEALLVASSIPYSELEGQPEFDRERPRRSWKDARGESSPTISDPDGERSEIRKWLAENVTDEDPSLLLRIAFQEERGLRGEAKARHLFSVDPDSPESARRVTQGFYDHRDASFSPDGSWIVYVGSPRNGEHPDRLWRSSLYRMRADGSQDQVVLDDEAHSYRAPRFDLSGERLYFVASETRDSLFQQGRLGSLELGAESEGVVWHSRELDSHVQDPELNAAGEVLFTTNWQGNRPLYALQPSSGELLKRLVGVHVEQFATGGERVLLSLSSASNPCELYLLNQDGGLRRLTDMHASWLEGRALSVPSERWIEREDGTRVQYWVMPPTKRIDAERYPTVLAIHGGPSVMWGPGNYSMWHEFQLLCSWGYGLVYANPRGSGGYGFQHQKGNYQNWGEGPAGDVLACLDAAGAEHEWIDSERLFVTGGSYAGYLTAWIVAKDQRFRAAVAQRGVYDLQTFFGEGNAWRLVKLAFGGYPWEPETRAILTRESPFTHVDGIETPLLIMHASRDLRTGVSQSEMLYRALKQLRRPVEYVRYPAEGHELSRSGDPWRRVDRLNRIVEFFERWAQNDRTVPSNRTREDPAPAD